MGKLKPTDGFSENLRLAQDNVNAGNDERRQEAILKYLLSQQPDYVPTYYHAGKVIRAPERGRKSYWNLLFGNNSRAKKAGDNKTAGELNEALNLLNG